MTTYFALVLKDEDSAYGVVFPDVPGCFSAGDTFEEAARNSAEALRAHVEAASELGRTIPPPRSFDDLLHDPDVSAEARLATVIAVSLPSNDEPVDVSVPLEPQLLDAVDKAAARAGVSRSAFIAEAAREKVAG